MQALGHSSKAVHRAYSRKAQVKLPPLEEYERKIVPLTIASAREITTSITMKEAL
jgi:predicted RNA-binding protein Jag